MAKSSYKVGIKNLEAFKRKLRKRLSKNPERHLEYLVQRAATEVANEAINSIRGGNKSGRTYMRGQKIHTASAAGEAPAADTGILHNSITTRVTEEGTKVIGQIIANSNNLAPYAKDLEFGTTNMRPRPYMQPALERNRPKIKRMFKKGGYID